jgi:hypothetical protein
MIATTPHTTAASPIGPQPELHHTSTAPPGSSPVSKEATSIAPVPTRPSTPSLPQNRSPHPTAGGHSTLSTPAAHNADGIRTIEYPALDLVPWTASRGCPHYRAHEDSYVDCARVVVPPLSCRLFVKRLSYVAAHGPDRSKVVARPLGGHLAVRAEHHSEPREARIQVGDRAGAERG